VVVSSLDMVLQLLLTVTLAAPSMSIMQVERFFTTRKSRSTPNPRSVESKCLNLKLLRSTSKSRNTTRIMASLPSRPSKTTARAKANQHRSVELVLIIKMVLPKEAFAQSLAWPDQTFSTSCFIGLPVANSIFGHCRCIMLFGSTTASLVSPLVVCRPPSSGRAHDPITPILNGHMCLAAPGVRSRCQFAKWQIHS
jgi:hypothetical protein